LAAAASFAGLDERNGYSCAFRYSAIFDECEGMFYYDADAMQGGDEGMLVCCICACHRKPAES